MDFEWDMSNTSSDHKHSEQLLTEYHFDYQKAKPNRFAVRDEAQQSTVVTLDKDVAQVFKISESVNKALRSLIRSRSIEPNNV